MALMYPIKHVFRNWKLFTALLIGITLAATLFAGISVKANVAAEQTLDKQISSVMTDMDCSVSLNMSNLALIYRNITTIKGVKDVDYMASFSSPVGLPSDNYTNFNYVQIASFPNSSMIYNEWTNKPSDGIPTNYTYILAGSDFAKKVNIGDNITTMINFPTPKYYNTSTVYVNLTVAGFAILTDKGYALVSGNTYYVLDSESPYTTYRSDFLIISWENTLEPLWKSTLDSSTVDLRFYINVDRENLISPWNVQTSISNINLIADTIQNQILGYLSHAYVDNALSSALSSYQYNISNFLISFFFVSIPIFFVAWYLGSTVSDVSFNIRRREIGLLSTKGLSSGQIQRMFLSEALVIGLIGGFLGVVGGLIINQYYAGSVNLNTLFTSQMYSPEIMVITIAFGVILALTSVFWSSRKASRIPAVEALRDDMSIDDKSHRKIFPLIALILGSYKIVIYALGVNIISLMSQWLYSGGNIFLSVLYEPVYYFDLLMTYIGPFLFFWGLTKLLIRDSTKFQTAVSKISSVMGDLGALAAKNVRRNPARLAAIAFVIALIMGLAVQVTGQIASQENYIQRTVQALVGADINVNLANASEGQIVLKQILENVSGIQNATVERILTPQISESYSSITVKTIDPDTWALSAHYENDWFSGNSLSDALKAMKADNSTIILSRSIAKQYNLKLYDFITIDFSSCPRRLKIVGFFGPEPSDNSGIIYSTSSSGTFTSGSGTVISPLPYYYGNSYNSPYDCYAPRDLFNVTDASSGIYQVEDFTTNILIKLNPDVNGTQVAEQIRSLDLDINIVTSLDEEWQSSTQMNNSATYSSLQTLGIQSFGLIFAVISASVGTALIAIVSLKERSREATLMSVRGLSYRQLVWMFLVESMAIITFAVILGVIVGVIIVYGTVASANASAYTYTLVAQRLIFPADAITTIGTYAALIYASTIGAIIVMTSQYVTKLEKMVRAR
jgi:ABC-type antimicrobial peptide transport system permease subunit